MTEEDYQINAFTKFQKKLEKLPDHIRDRILPELKKLTRPYNYPGIVKLKNFRLKNAYRIRIGEYRLIFVINNRDNLVELYDIDTRGSINY